MTRTPRETLQEPQSRIRTRAVPVSCPSQKRIPAPSGPLQRRQSLPRTHCHGYQESALRCYQQPGAATLLPPKMMLQDLLSPFAAWCSDLPALGQLTLLLSLSSATISLSPHHTSSGCRMKKISSLSASLSPSPSLSLRPSLFDQWKTNSLVFIKFSFRYLSIRHHESWVKFWNCSYIWWWCHQINDSSLIKKNKRANKDNKTTST